MIDEFAAAVAAAVAGSAGTAIVGEGRRALTALVRLVRERLSKESSTEAALQAAEADPADKTKVTRLAMALDLTAVHDKEFESRLRALWREVNAGTVVDHGSVVNTVNGQVRGNLVQAHTIDGGVAFSVPSGPNLGHS